MEKAWLFVELVEGMFPGERVAKIKTFDGHNLSLFVSTTSIKEGNGRGSIQVELLQSAPGVSLVGLPSEAVEGTRVAKVSASELTK